MIFVDASDQSGGPRQGLVALLQALDREEVAAVASPAGMVSDEAKRLGVRWVELPAASARLSFLRGGLRLRRHVSAARRRSEGSLAVIGNTHSAGLRVAIATAGMRKCRAIVFFRHSRVQAWDRRVLRTIRRLQPHVRFAAVSANAARLLEDALRDAHGCILEEVVPTTLREEYFEVGDRKLHSWRQGRTGYDPSPRVLYVGSPSPQKGLPTLLGAVKEWKGPEKLIVDVLGVTRSEASALMGGAAELKVIESGCQIRFRGRVVDPTPYYGAADAVVQPSFQESFGRPLLEAAATATPIVCSDNAGHRDILDSGCAARVFPVGGDVAAAAALYRSLYGGSTTARQVELSWRWAQGFRPEIVVQNLRAISTK